MSFDHGSARHLVRELSHRVGLTVRALPRARVKFDGGRLPAAWGSAQESLLAALPHLQRVMREPPPTHFRNQVPSIMTWSDQRDMTAHLLARHHHHVPRIIVQPAQRGHHGGSTHTSPLPRPVDHDPTPPTGHDGGRCRTSPRLCPVDHGPARWAVGIAWYSSGSALESLPCRRVSMINGTWWRYRASEVRHRVPLILVRGLVGGCPGFQGVKSWAQQTICGCGARIVWVGQ